MIFHILIALTMQLQPPAPPEIPAAVVNVPRLVAESMAGQAATARLKAFQAEKQKLLSDKQAEVQQLTASRAIAVQVQKAQLELERLTQDARTELADLDRQLQAEFDRRLRPVVAQIADEDHIGIVFEYPQQMILWIAPAVDITTKVIERLDAASTEKK